MQTRGDQLDSGSIIGGYRIDEMISRGGMGVVYRATNVALRRIYALKVLAPELSDDVQFRERFKREMRIAASLNHPNVVAIHYAGEDEGLLFLAMDYIHGTDLRQLLLKSGPLDPERSVDLLEQFASALDAAHTKGLVHRDVKPANMLITVRDGEEHGYLTDFGLAKRSDNIGALTRKGVVVGTVDYMAPEQVSGDPTDARTDIYALGCVFFQMLTGRVPYERDNSVATLYAHVHEPPPALPAELCAEYPRYAAVIEKAMAKAPEDRYLSAGDFARDALAALSGQRYSGPQTSVATGEASITNSGEHEAPVLPAPHDETIAVEAEPSPAPPAPIAQPAPAAPARDPEPVVPGPDPEPAAPARGPEPAVDQAAAASVQQPPSTPPTPVLPTVSAEPPRPAGGAFTKYRWPALAAAVLVAGGVAAAVALSSGSSSSKPPAAPLFAAAARPVPTNDVTGNGSAKLQLRGNVATVTVNTNGLLNAVHFMHIHGGTGNCPPATAALTKNGQQFIPAAVGDRFYGPVVTSLTQHGDTSAASHVTPSLYATTGAITYTRSITLAPGVAGEIRNGLAVLVVHGIDHNGNSRYDDSLGAGVELNAPALCGPLFPSQTAAGKGRTVYVASLGREDPGPASLSLLCHLGDVADPRVGAA